MDHREHLPIGAELVGDYRIDAILGQGGFGVTYKAHHLKLNTAVAVKEYFPSEFATRDQTLTIRPKSDKHGQMFEWGRSRFIEEAQTLARFDHPAIVRVLHVFEALNSAYMVLKFEAGRTFGQWLEALGRSPGQEELDRLVTPLLDALELMHGADFIHRDIAPDNIIIRPDGSPVLLDFGAARQAVAAETKTLTGIIKAGYSPPEQYLTRGSAQGPWTDVYALGATLYKAVTGTPPTEAPDRQLAQMQGEPDQVRPAAELTGGRYRSGFLSALDMALRLTPKDRPQSVSAIRALLQSDGALAAEPTVPAPRVATPGTVAVRASPPEVRQPAAASPRRGGGAVMRGALIALVLGLAGGSYTLYDAWRVEERARQQKEVRQEAERKRQEEARRRAEAEQRRTEAAERRAQAERQAWAEAERDRSIAAYRRYLAVYPDGLNAPLARQRITALEEEARRKTEEAERRRREEEQYRSDGRMKVLVGPRGRQQTRWLKPGAGKEESLKDCDTCPEMVVVPAGGFLMGSPESEPGRTSDEGPQVRVSIAQPFAVGKFAVTFAEWDACVADGGCTQRPGDEGWGRGRRPVINVTWDDADHYVSWLSKKTGHTYRLLSESEREYVTRAGTTTPFWWGASIRPDQANYDGRTVYAGGAKGEYRGRTVPVDSFRPNPWGLYNVHGNVFEFTADCWNDSHSGNPADGTARTTGDCGRRVVRGGSWGWYPRALRSALRGRYYSGFRNHSLGFRVARTLDP